MNLFIQFIFTSFYFHLFSTDKIMQTFGRSFACFGWVCLTFRQLLSPLQRVLISANLKDHFFRQGK